MVTFLASETAICKLNAPLTTYSGIVTAEEIIYGMQEGFGFEYDFAGSIMAFNLVSLTLLPNLSPKLIGCTPYPCSLPVGMLTRPRCRSGSTILASLLIPGASTALLPAVSRNTAGPKVICL